MRQTLIGRAVAIAAIVVAACSAGAVAAPFFTDTFDSYSNGNLEPRGGWSGGGSTVRVTGSLFHSSAKSVRMNYLVYGAGEATHTVATNGVTCFVDFYVAMDTAAPVVGENLGYVKLYNSNDEEVTRVYLSHQQLKVLVDPGTAVLVQDNIGTRVWQHVRLGIHPSSNTMDVWVNDVQKLAGATTFGTPSDVARIGIAEWSSLGNKFTKSEIYIDSIVVEPSSATATRVFSPFDWMCWEYYNVMFPSILYDSASGSYTMWYTGSGAAELSGSNWDQWQIGSVTSTDGITWARRPYDYEPVLRAHKFYEGDLIDPATYSQIFDSIFAYGGAVIKDGSTYKMWYTGWGGDSEQLGGGITRKINQRIGYATSSDGIEWTKVAGGAGAGSILGLGASGTADSKGAAQPFVRKEGSTYRMWYEGFDGSAWRILSATSNNGTTWTTQGTALSPGAAGSMDEKGAIDPVVIFRNNIYELWYIGQSAGPPYYQVLRATSSNGDTWTKVPGEVELHPDDVLDNGEKLHLGSIFVNGDNSCRVYFGKQNTTTQNLTYGTASTKKTHIYMEVVNP